MFFVIMRTRESEITNENNVTDRSGGWMLRWEQRVRSSLCSGLLAALKKQHSRLQFCPPIRREEIVMVKHRTRKVQRQSEDENKAS